MAINQLKTGALLSYATIVLNTLVGLLYTPFMLRMMGQSEYGLYSLAASIISYLTILDLGFANALVRYTSKYRTENKEHELSPMFGMFFILYLVIGIIAAVIGLIFFFNVEKLFDATMSTEELNKVKVMMLMLTFNLAFTFPMSVWGAIITAYERFVFQKIVNIVRIICNTIVMIFLLFWGYKAIALVVVLTLFNVVTLLLNYYYCKRKLNVNIEFRKFNFCFLKEIASYSFWIFLNAIVDRIYWGTGQFVLGIYAGAKSIAIYALAIQLQGMYDSFSNAISSVFFPRITKLVVEKNINAISDLFIRIGRIQFYVMSLILSGFFVFGKQFILWWAGDSYETTYYICLLIFTPLIVPLIQNLGIYIMQAYKKVRFRAILYIVVAVLSLLLSILLARKYEGIGCAIATCVGLSFGHILIMNFYYYYKIKINIPKFWKQISHIAIVPICLAVAFCYLRIIIDFSNILNYVLMLVCYVFLYCVSIYLFALNDYEKQLFHLKSRKSK